MIFKIKSNKKSKRYTDIKLCIYYREKGVLERWSKFEATSKEMERSSKAFRSDQTHEKPLGILQCPKAFSQPTQ